jgi:hypothetical protein
LLNGGGKHLAGVNKARNLKQSVWTHSFLGECVIYFQKMELDFLGCWKLISHALIHFYGMVYLFDIPFKFHKINMVKSGMVLARVYAQQGPTKEHKP